MGRFYVIVTSYITLTETNTSRGVQDSMSLFGHTINTIELQDICSKVCHGNVGCCNTIKHIGYAYTIVRNPALCLVVSKNT